MAGNAARRITVITAILSLAASAMAGWENSHFCRLSDDRLLITSNTQRFVLVHGAAWELADPAQKPALVKWLAQSKLPGDLGQLVTGMPADHELPLAGELDVTLGSERIEIVLKHGGQVQPMALGVTSQGVKFDAEALAEFEQIASDLGKPPSTLLVLMADRTGEVTAAKAWSAFFARMAAKPEFFIYLDKEHGMLWVRKLESSAPASTPSKPNPSSPAPVGSTPQGGGFDWQSTAILVVGGLCMLGAGLFAGMHFGSKSKPAPKPEPVVPAPNRFQVTANERKLVEKVRAEIRKLNWDEFHHPTGDEFITLQMIERFDNTPALQRDLETLKKYRQFKDAHDAFQKRIDDAVAEAKASAEKVGEVANLLQHEKANVQSLTTELARVKSAHTASDSQVKSAKKRIAELERQNAEFKKIYAELVNRTAAVCHDIVLTRPRGDAWALAFAYIVDYTLANLGLARQCDDQRLFNAMLMNLHRLSEAMAKSFPDRKLVIDPWQRSVKAFGDIRPPEYDSKPHPHVDSLSQILLTLRDTGPSLADFREFYAPSESGLYIIRPA